MTGLELPPLGAPFAFSQPFDGSSIVIPAVLYTDFWQWLAISGEPYPPALSGFTYQNVSGFPCYGSSTAGAHCAFPALPRIGPGQSAAGTVKYTWRALHNTTLGGGFTFAPFASSASAFFIRADGVFWTDPAFATQFGTYSSPPATGVWHDYALTLGTATFDLTIDGVRPTLSGAPALPATLASTYQTGAAPEPRFDTTAGGPFTALAKLKVAWS